MDLDEADIRLLTRVRTRRRYARLARLVNAGLATVFAGIAVWAGLLAPDITAGLGPNADISFEPLRWQARAVWIFMALTFGMAFVFSAISGVSASEQNKSDALILKLLGQRSGFPDQTR